MVTAPPPHIPIHPVALLPNGGCAGCVPGSQGPVCRSLALGEPCLAPSLQGQAELLHEVMAALNEVIEPTSGRGIVDLHLVRSLRIEDGEAELVLSFQAGCGGGHEMADEAFHTLRRLLPDTDIYVRHAP
jgi:metal-sulfur cluster biosynthetic enzyme